MSKFAEKMTILLNASEGLFTRLHRCETIFSNPKTQPSFYGNKGFEKLSSAFEKAFPKLPNDIHKISGYADIIQKDASSLCESLGPHYYTFVDLQEWCLYAKDVIVEISKGFGRISYETNPTITLGFLELVQVYVRLLFAMQRCNARIVILGVHCRAFFHVKTTLEFSFDRTAEFVSRYSSVLGEVQADLRPAVPMIVDAVMSLYMPLVQNTDVSQLRNKGAHNLTLKPDSMSLPSDDSYLYDLVAKDNMQYSALFGLLASHEGYLRLNPDFLASLLQDGLHVPVYRDLLLDATGRFNYVLKSAKPKKGELPNGVDAKDLTKQLATVKKSIELAEKSLERGDFLVVHQTRRVYVRQEMSNMLNIFTDTPGLLAPKFPMLLSLLALANSELLWLIRHRTQPIPKGMKLKEEDFNDPQITDIIYLINRLGSLARQHQDVIRDYYLEFLAGADLRGVQKEAGSVTLPQAATQLVHAILSELQGLRPGAPCDLTALRLNIFRLESFATSSECTSSVPAQFVAKFVQVARHSEFVDLLPRLLDRHAGMQDLWYFREGFKQAFVSSTLGGSSQPARCMVYLRLLAQFAETPSPFCPDEHVSRGKSCVILGRNFLERIAQCITNGLVSMANQFQEFDLQRLDVNAAFPVLRDWSGFKPAKDYVPPAVPGSESGFGARRDYTGLASAESTLFQLCSALNEDISISIYDTVFVPREFVQEHLRVALAEFVFKKTSMGTDQIERPSILERRINNFCASLMMVENYLDLSLGNMMRDVFLLQVFHPQMPEMGSAPLSGPMQAPHEWEMTMVKPLVLYYVHFLTTHLMGDRQSVVWSPNSKSFVSRTGNAFKAEEYASFNELRALCRIVGPYGVKLLDQEVLKVVRTNVAKLKDALTENRLPCLDLQKAFSERDAEAVALVRKFSRLDDVVALLTNIGLGLHFRDLLHEALGWEMQEHVPFLYQSVECAFLQYARNTFIVDDLLPCDLLAAECGIPVGTADQAFKLAIRDAIGSSADDVLLWACLPTLAAASFLSKSWLEADFRTAVEGYRTNLHCISRSLIALLVAYKGLTSQSRLESEIAQLLEMYLEQSSVLLLRASQVDVKLLQKTLGVQAPSYNWADCMIFLDRFLEEAPFLERETLERVLPYGLLRALYHSVYTPKDGIQASTIRSSKKPKEATDGI